MNIPNKMSTISYTTVQLPQNTPKIQYQPLTSIETTNAALTGLGIGTVGGIGIGILKKKSYISIFNNATKAIIDYIKKYPKTVQLEEYNRKFIEKTLLEKSHIARETYSNLILIWKVPEAAVIGGVIGTMASILIADIMKKRKAETEVKN